MTTEQETANPIVFTREMENMDCRSLTIHPALRWSSWTIPGLAFRTTGNYGPGQTYVPEGHGPHHWCGEVVCFMCLVELCHQPSALG